jgi:translation initiation factor IF-3
LAIPPQDNANRNNNNKSGASFVRTNFKIRVPEVRVVDAQGKMLGVMQTRKAQALAESLGLDLVEITPGAQPPVCKIMDYGKFRYEESIKQKQARKNAKAAQVKEIKFHAATDVGDVNRKVREILGFIEQGNKVKVSLMFRGRENAHRELGIELIERVVELCAEKTSLERPPKLDGRVVSCMLAPKSAKAMKKAAEKPAAPQPEA